VGGEPWKFRAPWQADISRVLADARARVFRDRLYETVPGRDFETLDALDRFFTSEPEFDENGEWTGEGADGTRSLLDIRAVGTEIAPGVTAPLGRDELVSLFGSERPTAADLTAARESALYERLTRGDSLHVVLYVGDEPAEVVFYGYSWD
jgi:hypothetical protein